MEVGDVALTIAFVVLAVVAVAGAGGVLVARNIFHSALFLVLVFVAVAGLYITLSADFIAAIQVLVYAGAVAVLLLFAIMLTHDSVQGNPWGRFAGPAFFVAALVATVVILVVVQTVWPAVPAVPSEPTSTRIANALFNHWVLPFEVASVVLLAALVGAIVLAREETDVP